MSDTTPTPPNDDLGGQAAAASPSQATAPVTTTEPQAAPAAPTYVAVPTPHAKRPLFVTFLAVLGVLQGLVVLGLGVFATAENGDDDLLRQINDSEALDGHQLTSDHLLAIGIVGIALGVVLILLAIMLLNGSNFVRWLLVLLSLVNAAVGLHSLVALDGEQRMTGSLTLVLSLAVVWLLVSNEQSKAFFDD